MIEVRWRRIAFFENKGRDIVKARVNAGFPGDRSRP